jgi:S-adenosylmethionine decarboxylase
MAAVDPGEEWVVDAYGCEPAKLGDEGVLRGLLERVVEELGLKRLDAGFWYRFDGGGGVTGLVPLRESHLAVHTWPERRMAALNLYCCRGGCAWSWPERLGEALGASKVTVRRLPRGGDGDDGQG